MGTAKPPVDVLAMIASHATRHRRAKDGTLLAFWAEAQVQPRSRKREKSGVKRISTAVSS